MLFTQVLCHWIWQRGCHIRKGMNFIITLSFNFVFWHTLGHQDQDRGNVGQMSLFDWKLEAATDREKQKQVQQDLSLKCSAWKDLIPCLKWKSPRPKQILDPKFYLGPLEDYGSEKFCVWNKFLKKKKLGPEKSLVWKNFGTDNFIRS